MKKQKSKKHLILIPILLIIFIITLIILITKYNYEQDLNKYTQPNTILLMYKNNCPDCVTTKGDTDLLLKDRENTYWIDISQPIGKELANKYNIHDIPCIIYIKSNGDTYISTTYLEKNNQTITNKTAIQNAIDMQNNNK